MTSARAAGDACAGATGESVMVVIATVAVSR
jgi:hypothetical protein